MANPHPSWLQCAGSNSLTSAPSYDRSTGRSRAARKADKGVTETDVRGALLEFQPIWNELFPVEQARIVELLVERVDLQPACIDLRLRIEGLTFPQ